MRMRHLYIKIDPFAQKEDIFGKTINPSQSSFAFMLKPVNFLCKLMDWFLHNWNGG